MYIYNEHQCICLHKKFIKKITPRKHFTVPSLLLRPSHLEFYRYVVCHWLHVVKLHPAFGLYRCLQSGFPSNCTTVCLKQTKTCLLSVDVVCLFIAHQDSDGSIHTALTKLLHQSLFESRPRPFFSRVLGGFFILRL